MTEADFRARLDEVGRDLEQATASWRIRKRRRRQALALACTAFISGAAALAVSTHLGSSGVEPAAAQVLERAAHADAGSSSPRAGRYLYVKTHVSTRNVSGAGSQTVLSAQTTELWAGADGSGVQVVRPERSRQAPASPAPAPDRNPATGEAAPVKAPDSRARTQVRRYGKGTIAAGEVGSLEPTFRDNLLRRFGLSARDLERLAASQPRFDARLRAAVDDVVKDLVPASADRAAARDGQAFFLVAALLGQWGESMPVHLRRALYTFTGTLRGIRVDEGFTDQRGRRGIALSSGAARIVLAPDTYRLRATSYTIGDTETTIETLRTALVDHPRDRPGN